MNDFDKALNELNLTYAQIELIKQAVEKYVIGEPLSTDSNGRYNLKIEQRKALWGGK